MGNIAANKDSELIARRWAKALMELASEESGVSKEDILDDLREVDENIKSSIALEEALKNPSISIEEKQAVLARLFEFKLMPIVYKFITVLNAKGRLGILAAIADEFQKELEDVNNVIRVTITSAIELSEEKKLYVRNKVAEKLKKDVIPNWNVDFSIIGGLVFNINETIVDNSIRHRLESLSKNIMKG